MKNIKQLVAVLIVALVGFLAVGLVGLHYVKNSLIESEKQSIATLLNIARNQSVLYINQYKQGLLTKEETDNKIIQFLSALQYKSAYVWANDNHGIARVHARAEVVGQFQSSYIEHMKHLASTKIFYLTENNIKPITNQRVFKINGVTKIPEWNWVIGFGVYMDDINKSIFDSALAFIITGMISISLLFSVVIYMLRSSDHD
jgi:methyl-accepting chemotaxis protein